jgi:hypothetical protein
MDKKPHSRLILFSGALFILIFMTLSGSDWTRSAIDIKRDVIQIDTNSPKQGISAYKEFFVSPDGDDANNGTLAAPFKTIDKARREVASWNTNMTGDIYIWLRDGTYTIQNSITLNQTDGGTNGHSVIYSAYPGEKPIISGGIPIGGWQHNGSGIWVANTTVADFRQLYVNGTRAIRARGEPTMIKSTDGDGHELNDLAITKWKNLQDIEIVYKTLWTLPRIRINGFYTIKNKLLMQQPAFSASRAKSADLSTPTWIENAIELLDEPGEWYLDKATGKVYYIPRPGEDLTSAEVIAPAVQTLLMVEGNDTNKARNLKIQGLSFQYSTWLEPNQYGTCFVDLQANVFFTLDGTRTSSKQSPGNVILRYAQNVWVENCTFSHFGSGGIDLQRGVNESRIIGNTFKDLSGIAIQIGEMSLPNLDPDDPKVVRDNWILNNYITNCSVEYMGGPGIFTGYVRNIRIEHNTISNLPYTGISLGWGWSNTTTILANNTIKFNRIYGVMNYLADGAGIYTLSTQAGTNVSYNVIYDCGWNGLYPDERTNGTTWTYNVVWDSFNTFQNHIMAYDEMDPAEAYKLNNISMNYLDVDPWFAAPKKWADYEKKQQIIGLKPGDADFPQWIVDLSGVEPEYQHLIPENEWHWKFKEITADPNWFTQNPLFLWFMSTVFPVLGILGIVKTIQKGGMNNAKNE